jgi:plasmid maintenance system antidote protein VapI
MTADTAMRLARYFGTSAKLCMGLQAEFDLNLAAAIKRDIQKIKPREDAVCPVQSVGKGMVPARN